MKSIIEKAKNYKKKVAGAFISINQDDINSKITGGKVFLTTKIDGEFDVLHYNNGKAVLINGNGKIKEDLPFLSSVEKNFQEQNIKNITIAGELHIKDNGKRSRIFEVMSAISNSSDDLTFSPFDIIDIEEDEFNSEDYSEVISKLSEIFKENSEISPVELTTCSPNEVEEIFQERVVKNNAEGLVIRIENMPIVYKLKPQHTIDLAVIGFTEGDEGKIREILLALNKEDGSFVRVVRVGNGLTETLKSELFSSLNEQVIDSKYLEADGRRVAFKMVPPTIVVEVSINELLTENSKGFIKNPQLVYDAESGYSLSSNINGVSLLHPVFKRIRDDKQVNEHDVRFSQITDIVHLVESVNKNSGTLPKSEIIFREVYTKKGKGKTNVQKFVAWKTNKEDDANFPAYVMNYTNFSPTRKEPLKKDVRISNNKEQILELLNAFIEKNIKKGWEKQ